MTAISTPGSHRLSPRSEVANVGHQVHFDLRCFLRNREGVFWTLAMPILFLLIFGSVFQHQNVAVPGGRIDEPVYYVPGIIAFGIIASTFSNLVTSVVRYREAGIYKRRRATPVGSGIIISSRALVAAFSALVMTIVLLVIGWGAFAAHIPGRTAPAFVLDVIIGAVVFCCLGFAVASLIRNADAAQPTVLGIVLPLSMISGIFIPILELPAWLIDVAKVFPIHALADAFLTAYNPHTLGSGINWVDLGILAAWGVVGLVVALRRFSWLPRST
jgi:ABC-2 type transport system permease protein